MSLASLDPGRYLVAVSGGVDSVVLLDLLSQQKDLELIVAHFDHGIRSVSHQDAEFVSQLARKYSLEFIGERVELGEKASEEVARNARYAFLKKVQHTRQAQAIITAHHADDVLETVIINLMRGTGWRGLGALRSEKDIVRPLLQMPKSAIYQYAKNNSLSWREDETNQDTRYLRNHIRVNVVSKLTLSDKNQLLELHDKQVDIKEAVDEELKKILQLAEMKPGEHSRYFLINIDQAVALELLKALTGALYPQLQRALIAVKTAKPGTRHQIGGGVSLYFTKTSFIVERPSLVVS